MDKKTEAVIGKNIKLIREQKGITQELLATRLQLEGIDMTRSAVAKIEVGQRHVYVDELVAVQKIFNVPFEEILKV